MSSDIFTQEAIDAIKCIAYEVISETIGSPYDYIDTSRDDLLTLGEIYGIVKVTNTICEDFAKRKEETDDN